MFKLIEVLYLRSLIGQLEGVDPRKMKHEEKLAFWINVHNALVMHVLNLVNRNTNSHDTALYNSVMISFSVQAYLAYGIPQNNTKRVFLLLKVRSLVSLS